MTNWSYLSKFRDKWKMILHNHWELMVQSFLNAYMYWKLFTNEEIGWNSNWNFNGKIGNMFCIVLSLVMKSRDTKIFLKIQNNGVSRAVHQHQHQISVMYCELLLPNKTIRSNQCRLKLSQALKKNTIEFSSAWHLQSPWKYTW